jgi:hypothetical protein
MTKYVGPLNYQALPRFVVANQFVRLILNAQTTFIQALGPDVRRLTYTVSIFLPDKVRRPVLVTNKTWIDGAVGLTDDGSVVGPGVGATV